jgi:aspartate dehydrogenase
LIELAKSSGGRIILATGALLGLDAVRAAAEGHIQSVTMITRKPPKSLRGAPYLLANHIDIDHLSAPLRLFDGSAREGALGFPANVNVAAALALAGIGPDRTRLEIWADPSLSRNTHTIKVEADSARFEMTIENVPSPDKPGTGRITALSVIAALRALTATLRVGT